MHREANVVGRCVLIACSYSGTEAVAMFALLEQDITDNRAVGTDLAVLHFSGGTKFVPKEKLLGSIGSFAEG